VLSFKSTKIFLITSTAKENIRNSRGEIVLTPEQ